MTLFTATLLPALFLIVTGIVILSRGEKWREPACRLLRSDGLTLVLMGAASAWFLYKVTQWGEADFGNFKQPAFVFFALVAIGSWIWVRDFLVVRAAAILMLLAALPLLGAARMEWEYPGRLFMVGLVYAGIVAALYFGTVPYMMREFFRWFFSHSMRCRIGAAGCILYGLLLIGIALSY